MGNSNRNQRHEFKCCAHGQTSTVNYQCSRFTQFISPCCMHGINEVRNTCDDINLYRIVLYYNAAQLALLLASTIEFLLPDTIMTVVGLFCLFVYVLGKQPRPGRQQYNTYVGMCLLSIVYAVAKVIVTIVPSFFCSFWTVFLGLFGLAYIYPKVYKKSGETRVRRTERARLIRQEKCCICFDKNSTHTVYPCLHASYCAVCVTKIEDCALCRSPISDRRPIPA